MEQVLATKSDVRYCLFWSRNIKKFDSKKASCFSYFLFC